LRLLKQEEKPAAIEEAPAVTRATGASAATNDQEADDFFSPFPDADSLIEEVESPDGLSIDGSAAEAAAADADADEKKGFKTARKRHSIMPVDNTKRRSAPLLDTSTSSCESIDEDQEEDTVVTSAAAEAAPLERKLARASTRRAAAVPRASSRRGANRRKVKFAPAKRLISGRAETPWYDRTSMCPALYSCDVCSRQFLAGLAGFEHYFHCDQCEDFDICAECKDLTVKKKDHHKGAHTFSEVDPGTDHDEEEDPETDE